MIKIWFTTDRYARPIAYRVSYHQMRCFRISLDEAKLLVATGKATKMTAAPPWK